MGTSNNTETISRVGANNPDDDELLWQLFDKFTVSVRNQCTCQGTPYTLIDRPCPSPCPIDEDMIVILGLIDDRLTVY